MSFLSELGESILGEGTLDFLPSIDSFIPSFGGSSSSASDGDKGGSLFGGLLNRDTLSLGLQGGLGLLKYLGEGDARDSAADLAEKDARFKYLLELAKLKYGQKGGGGGGGGSTRNKNADLIEVLNAGTDQQLRALNQLSGNYTAAIR